MGPPTAITNTAPTVIGSKFLALLRYTMNRLFAVNIESSIFPSEAYRKIQMLTSEPPRYDIIAGPIKFSIPAVSDEKKN